MITKFLTIVLLFVFTLNPLFSEGHNTEYENPFSLIKQKKFYGDFSATGNSVLCQNDGTGACDNNYNGFLYNSNLIYKHDDASITRNSSSAKLTLPSDILGENIVWAGLYWQGHIAGKKADEKKEIQTRRRDKVVFKTPDGKKHNITASKIWHHSFWGNSPSNNYTDRNGRQHYSGGGYRSLYQGFKDVTSLVQKSYSPSSNIFTVGDIKANQGQDWFSYYYGGAGDENDNIAFGFWGNWTLLVVYQHVDPVIISSISPKAVSIFHGFDALIPPFGNNSESVNVTVNGFLTPRTGTFNAKMLFYATGGEKKISRDSFEILDATSGNYQKVNNANNPKDNPFNGSISNLGVPVNPSIKYYPGMDLDTFEISSYMKNKQKDTKIRLSAISSKNDSDQSFPGIIAFSVDLYKPNICYDYSIRKDGFAIEAEDRNIVTVGTGNLAINVSIRSMESDFDLENTILKLDLTPSAAVKFTHAFYSPNTVNSLIDAVKTADSTLRYPEIGIGADVGTAPTTGGKVGIFERYFSQFNYALQNDSFNGHFDFDLNTSIDFGSGAVNVQYSTKNDTIPRCEQSKIYRPQWGAFNIERTNSNDADPQTQPDKRFPLYTQIAGRDFDFSLVAYDGKATPPYSKEIKISNMTVDVELIDVSSYDDNGSFFKCQNTDPGIIQTLPNGERSFFVTFPPKAAKRVDLKAGTANTVNVGIDTALRNAAFRMWVLVDENDTIVLHKYAKDDNTGFEKLYPTIPWSTTCTDNCNIRCTTGSDPVGNSDCYACLNTFCAKPICSRDNFSIRPVSYRIAVSDTNESKDKTDPQVLLGINDQVNTMATLAAGYKYKLDANATLFKKDDFAKGYTRNFFPNSNTDIVSKLNYNTNSGTTCRDTNHSQIGVRFENGQVKGNIEGVNFKLDSNNLHAHNNTGLYNYHIEDNNWTIVDQNRYPSKTFKTDDCLNDNTVSANGDTRSGCNISSVYTGSVLQYEDAQLRFEPYNFSVTNVNMSVPTDPDAYVYANDINTTSLTDLYMSIGFRGNISAQAKGLNVPLSNFVAGCTAKDVNFTISKYTTHADTNVSIYNVLGTDAQSDTKNTSYQRLYLDSAGNDYFTTEDNASTSNASITIRASEFHKDLNGSAPLRLYYNFEKSLTHMMNPVTIHYQTKEANSPLAQSSAHMSDNYLPSGIADINATTNVYYARIVSSKPIYTVPQVENDISVPIYIEVYCNDDDMNCTGYGLNMGSIRGSSKEWKVHQVHDSVRGDGLMASILDKKGLGKLSITPATPLDLNKDVNKTNVLFSINNTTERTYTTKIEITPGEPWLFFNPENPDDRPDFILTFVGNGGWAGKGNTGMVVDTNASADAIQKRIEW